MNQNENVVETSERINLQLGSAIAIKLIEAIEEDEQITSSSCLSFRALKDSLPEICQTLVEMIVLSPTPEIGKDNLTLFAAEENAQGSKHGYIRSLQDFEPEELVREFFLLKKVLIAELKQQLLTYSSEEILEKIALVDSVINRIAENSFQSYAEVRQRQQDELRQQIFLTNQELTRLVADNQESLAYLVHEIKNPLTSIIGYSDLFIRQQQNQPTANLKHIHQVLQQGRKVLRLVNDTAEISSCTQGNFQLRVRQIDVCSLIENITLSLKSSIEAKKLKLITSCAPEKLIVESDSLRLQQIITNLLINAIRYTPKGQIELACHATSGKLLEIKVADTGIGISESEQKRIFEPYFRCQKHKPNFNNEGVGLGLAIVSQLVSALKGKIELFSQIDAGSVFIVTIPLKAN